MGKTLFDKIWERHIVKEIEEGPTVINIDRHLIHEVTSPQAFSMIEAKGYPVWSPERTFATCDHNVPTVGQELFPGYSTLEIPSTLAAAANDPAAVEAVSRLAENTTRYGIQYFPLGSEGNGIVHVIGPEQGIVLCGQTIVCGDSHTATHGAFGNVAFGIGTSEVAMVLSSQCLMQNKPAQTRIEVTGHLRSGVSAKDLILYIISKLGTSGCTGTFVEYCGEAVQGLSMEGRMTVCNMSIEMGARGGLIAPDETTFRYIRGRKYAPKDAEYERAVEEWRNLYSDPDAEYDRSFTFCGEDVPVMVTYGTNPGMGMPLDGVIPSCAVGCDDAGFAKALGYMGFKVGEHMLGKRVDFVFLGSCTNGRIEDFREFATVVRGRHKSPSVTAWLVPGSKAVEEAIESEGLGDILREAGFEVRQPGCSACLAMNADKVPSGCLCVSTSNRNFEGRQGAGARTVLTSPATAAYAAVNGIISEPDFIRI